MSHPVLVDVELAQWEREFDVDPQRAIHNRLIDVVDLLKIVVARLPQNGT